MNQETDSHTPNIVPSDKQSKNFWKELIKLVLISIVIVIPFRIYIAQPFIVDGSSMDPTFETGDYLIVDELTYHFTTPERGSVMIFKYPKDTRKSFIKRVIGLPGETVSLSDGSVTIKNKDYPNGFKLPEPYVKLVKKDTVDYIVGENEYFVMGDNRAASADSRIWGPVPKADITGRPLLRLLPFAIFPGDYSQATKTNR